MTAALLALCLAAQPAANPLSLSDDKYAFILVGDVDLRAQNAEVEGYNGFALGRILIGARARPVDWFRVVLIAEWAQEKPALNDAFLEVVPLDWLRISVGFNRTPLFYSARNVQVETLPIPELPLVARAFWPRRDLGLEIGLRPERIPVEAWLRVGNGSGSPLGNDNMHLSFDGRVDLTLGREQRGNLPKNWGLRLGVGAHGEDAFDRAGISGTTLQHFQFWRPPVVNGTRAVTEAHLLASFGTLRLLVEGASAWESRSRDDDGNPNTPRVPLQTVQSRGVSAELTWVVKGQARYGELWPQDDNVGGPWSGGAVELAVRAERLWLGLNATDLTQSGATGGAAAARWWVNPFFALGVAGNLLRYDVAPLEEPDTTLSWVVLARATVRFR